MQHMRRTLLVLGLGCASTLAAAQVNLQDEQVVRIAYAKLAYAVQSEIVFGASPTITSAELAKKLQGNQLQFQIADMTSGPVSDIADKSYSDLVAVPDGRQVLEVGPGSANYEDHIIGKHATSYFASVSWAEQQAVPRGTFDFTVHDFLALAVGKNPDLPAAPTRYVTATITVTFQGKSRTYNTLWLFGSWGFTGLDGVVTDPVPFAKEGTFPSVLTDTSARSRPAVKEWLESNKKTDPSCTAGKVDVCCDPTTLACGLAAADVDSTKPAPTTTHIPKDDPYKGEKQ
jgi:hypothetical protein